MNQIKNKKNIRENNENTYNEKIIFFLTLI